MRISIALATCNGAAYLEGQIKSILNGSRKPDEWVVVDDASTDGSLELVRSLLNAAGAPGVSVMANPRNIGASAWPKDWHMTGPNTSIASRNFAGATGAAARTMARNEE